MEHKVSSELPPIQNENMQQQNMPQVEAMHGEASNERQAVQALEAPTQQSAQMSQPAVSPQMPQPVQAPIQQDPAGMPGIADDTDLIEKEWVEKAKEIVARTRQDPYLQNKEVERMKADYMKKRYDKDIKIAED